MPDDKTPQPTPEMIGGPGVEPEAAPAPKLVTVKHGGREIQVPEDVAQAWQEREREFNQSFSRQGAELGELRKRVSQAPPVPAREEPREPDINTLWFENPQAAYQKIVTDVETRIESRYRQDQALRGFWEGFYRANDDLREDGWVAQQIFKDNFEELADLPTLKAQEKLADLTRERILRLTRRVKPTTTGPRTDMLEPATGDRPASRQRDTDDEGPQSISDVLRQRHQQRRAGAKGA